MTITLFHTAEIHCASFDALRDRIAPGAKLTHVVRPNWLARAQGGISATLEKEITNAVAGAGGITLCTCTTIGAVAGRAGAIRIDQPMMQEAARLGGPILLAYALDSTWQPSLALLEQALEATGRPARVHPLPLTQYWPLFEAGQVAAFHAVIAGEIRQAVARVDGPGCVVLAQGSMAGAAELLCDLPCPVLASPELALRAALARI